MVQKALALSHLPLFPTDQDTVALPTPVLNFHSYETTEAQRGQETCQRSHMDCGKDGHGLVSGLLPKAFPQGSAPPSAPQGVHHPHPQGTYPSSASHFAPPHEFLHSRQTPTLPAYLHRMALSGEGSSDSSMLAPRNKGTRLACVSGRAV